MKIVILGRGRVGRGLHAAMKRAGGRNLTLASSRRLPRAALAEADAVLLAVSDSAIAEVAARVATRARSGASILHAAGARGLDELDACREVGMSVGALHPLVSFPDPGRPPSVQGATFILQGDPKALRAGKEMAKLAGARVIAKPLQGPAYHASAALVANGAAALATVGVRLLEKLGAETRPAERAVGALLRTVAENVERIGVPDSLTGPIMRGDDATVSAHRRDLERVSPDARRAYDAIAPTILACADAAGLASDRSRAVARALRRRIRLSSRS